jgi:hypothetical protein
MSEKVKDSYNGEILEFNQNERVIKQIEGIKRNIKELKENKILIENDF